MSQEERVIRRMGVLNGVGERGGGAGNKRACANSRGEVANDTEERMRRRAREPMIGRGVVGVPVACVAGKVANVGRESEP
jgi:hypothetical protein